MSRYGLLDALPMVDDDAAAAAQVSRFQKVTKKKQAKLHLA
ncbi:hypothetical protein TRV_06490 [Trichophyton verrucosum HKI 0517]|uniref:Uncharacterized protein n=1 Tax=Trichophyton verrucosum (strain HKI 0517) TaxID=663202 RepID=D4DH35_TRIVH|nr:uncharacterized protein TRV_06490 [Trichophyton verrucosum HKI 0517]EFE38830.1 hypothetical protein TRV_06490 [Trichophyton verrucosum HKI 0517]